MITLREAMEADGVVLKGKPPEMTALCPFHDDKNPSMNINVVKGLYHCHSCGAKGDAVTYLRERRGMSMKDALIATGKAEEHGRTLSNPVEKSVVTIFKYNDADGKLLIEARKIKQGTRKKMAYFYKGQQVRPDGASLPDIRPLYGLDKLAEFDDKAQVFVVEGEGTADWLARKIDFPVMSWLGGAQSMHLSDWSPLYGRSVVLIPDNNLAGKKAMARIGVVIADNKGAAFICKFSEKDCGDIEDTGWDSERLTEYISKNTKKMTAAQLGKAREVIEKAEAARQKAKRDAAKKRNAKAADPPPPPPPPPTDEDAPPPGLEDDAPPEAPPSGHDAARIDNEYFKILGVASGCYVILIKTKRRLELYDLPSNKVMNTESLLTICNSIEFWKSIAGAENSKSGKLASGDLQKIKMWFRSLENREMLKRVDASTIKGIGAHEESDGRVVFHMGDKLLVNDKPAPLNHQGLEFVYPLKDVVAPSLVIRADAAALLKNLGAAVCKMSWRKPTEGKIFMGWLASAAAAGVLDWRSHMWVLGEPGKGKTFLVEDVLFRVYQKLAQFVQVDGSQAGFRRRLQGTSMPLIFDDAEIDPIDRGKKMSGIEAVMRSATSGVGGRLIADNSSPNETISQTVRSSFLVLANRITEGNEADRQRRVVVGLTGKISQSKWMPIENEIVEALSGDKAAAILTHLIRNVRVIRDSVKSVRSMLAPLTASTRETKLLSFFVGGYAFASGSPGVVSPEFAQEVVKSHSFNAAREAGGDTSFNLIMSAEVRFKGGMHTIGSMLSELKRLQNNATEDDGQFSARDIDTALKNCGVMFREGKVFIGYTHEFIKRQFERKFGKINVRSALMEATFVVVKSAGQMRYNNSRCLSIEIDGDAIETSAEPLDAPPDDDDVFPPDEGMM